MKEEPTVILTTEQKDEKDDVGDPFIKWDCSIMTDYIYKMTIATVLFFICYPWMAFFCPIL